MGLLETPETSSERVRVQLSFGPDSPRGDQGNRSLRGLRGAASGGQHCGRGGRQGHRQGLGEEVGAEGETCVPACVWAPSALPGTTTNLSPDICVRLLQYELWLGLRLGWKRGGPSAEPQNLTLCISLLRMICSGGGDRPVVRWSSSRGEGGCCVPDVGGCWCPSRCPGIRPEVPLLCISVSAASLG